MGRVCSWKAYTVLLGYKRKKTGAGRQCVHPIGSLLVGGTEDFCSQRSLCWGKSGAVGLEVLVLSEGNLKSEHLHTLVLNTAAH